MQIVPIADNLQAMLKPVFWEKKEKYFNVPPAENFTQSAKCEYNGSNQHFWLTN